MAATELALLIIGAYLLGSIPTSYLAAKWVRGIDLRKFGSGNVGATNLNAITSKKLSVPVILFDLVKGLILLYVASRLGLGITEQLFIGLAAIVGHNWTIFLHFNGGRGIITSLGIITVLPVLNGYLPWEICAFLIVAGFGIFAAHNMPAGVVCGFLMPPLVSAGFQRPWPLILGFSAIFLIMVLRRLCAPKTSLTDSVPRRALYFNRFILDRDIRDKKAWLARKPRAPADGKPAPSK
jgi:glycerol-3-phosphate acyltransferase PlsY